jgi:hypothetical protein
LAATTPGHTVAVGETWPKETLVADNAGAASTAPALTRPSTRDNGHQPRQRTGAIVGLRGRRFAREGGPVLSVEFRRPEFSPKAAGRRLTIASLGLSWRTSDKLDVNYKVQCSVRY